MARPSRPGHHSKGWYRKSFLPSESGGMSTTREPRQKQEGKQEGKQDDEQDDKEDSKEDSKQVQKEVQKRSRKSLNSGHSQAPPRAVPGTKAQQD